MAENYNEQIERFLNGELSREERQDFEQELGQDAKLAKEVDFQQDLRDSIQLFGDRQLKNSIRNADEEAYQKGLLFTEQHISQYLEGELPEGASVILEKRMQTDQAFAESVALQQDLLESIEVAGDLQLKQSIREATSRMQEKGFFDQQSTRQQEQPRRQNRTRVISILSRRNLAMAASFLLLLSVGYFLFQPTGPKFRSIRHPL